MLSFWIIRVGPKSGEGHVKMAAETGVMQPHTQEGLETPEGGVSQGGFYPRASAGHEALPTPWLQNSGLQNCEALHFCYFNPSSFSSWLQQLQETNISLRVSPEPCR